MTEDFTDLAVILDNCEAAENVTDLEREQKELLARVRAEVAAKSDGLRRAIVWYEKLAEDAKRVMKQSEARAALIREYVKGEMQAAGVRSIKTATGSLTVRGNGGLQPLSVTLEELPDEYTRVTVTMPHELWSQICRLVAQTPMLPFGGTVEGCAGVTIRREADNARIREALGTGRATIPGANLSGRGESLVVK